MVCQASCGSCTASDLTDTGWCVSSRRSRSASPAAAGPWRGRQRQRARRPNRGGRHEAGDIDQTFLGDALAQIAVVAIAGIHQHDPLGKPLLPGLLDLLQRDLVLGLERDVLGDLAAAAALGILDPLVRHVKAVGHRQAGATATWQLSSLAELAAVLPRDA